jgi:hypothetical protein
MDERNPRNDSEDIGRTSEEDIVGSSKDDEFEDVDEIEDEDDSEDDVEDLEE